MRKLAIAMALASTVLSAPAVAQDRGFYAGIEAGALRAQESDFDYHEALRDLEDAATVDFKAGWDADIIGGYDFGAFRAEAEISRKRASIDEIFFANALQVPGAANSDASGSARVTSAMANLLLDFGEGGWRGYLGGGAGIARVKMNASNAAGTAGFSDSHNPAAFQAIAGFGREITPNLELGLKYRYFRTRALRFEMDDAPTVFEFNNGRFASHSLLASLIFNFKAPPAPPPPPPPAPPAPPPPPATQTCPDGSVILATDACPVPPPPPPPPPPEPERG